MKNKKMIAWTILSITTSFSLFAAEEVAWQRKQVDTSRCKRDGKTMQRCQEEVAEDNKYNFESELSPDVYKVYEDFTDDQKNTAMDYADRNRMTPNDAVRRVSAENS